MNLDKNLINKLVNITSNASIACHKYIGKNDKVIADKAATDSMRKNLNKLDIDGKVVIGEGELDEAPMLYIGEKLGTGKGPSVDIALDPLEGTNFCIRDFIIGYFGLAGILRFTIKYLTSILSTGTLYCSAKYFL